MSLLVGASCAVTGSYTGTAPAGVQYAFDTGTNWSDVTSFSVNTGTLRWQGTIILPSAGTHQIKVRKTNIPAVISALSGTFPVTDSGSGTTTPTTDTYANSSALANTSQLANAG